MKFEIELNEKRLGRNIPTGEFRHPIKDEVFVNKNGFAEVTTNNTSIDGSRIILKPKPRLRVVFEEVEDSPRTKLFNGEWYIYQDRPSQIDNHLYGYFNFEVPQRAFLRREEEF